MTDTTHEVTFVVADTGASGDADVTVEDCGFPMRSGAEDYTVTEGAEITVRIDRGRLRPVTGWPTRSATVVTPSGDVSVAVGPTHHIQAVLADALARIGRENDGTCQLVRDGDPLDPLTTVGAAGIEAGDELVLEANPAGGI